MVLRYPSSLLQAWAGMGFVAIACPPQPEFETHFLVWPYDKKRRPECGKGVQNNEDGREETPRKLHTEMDGQSAK